MATKTVKLVHYLADNLSYNFSGNWYDLGVRHIVCRSLDVWASSLLASSVCCYNVGDRVFGQHGTHCRK